ncbi:MAG: DJ-1/PfpI family protein [Muribaculaceae bacterium]|nr:DJ-1/PfpI family protein [Muribaculaceae bacterium]
MKRSFIFLATGFEEIEALGTADILRRSGMEVTLVSIHKERMVTGAHGITVAADVVLEGADFSDSDWLICPGGLPGAEHLANCTALGKMLTEHYDNGGRVAAICASPGMVLAPLGLLKGKKATGYPGFEDAINASGGSATGASVEQDGRIITGNGPSATFAFALAIAAATVGADKAQEVAKGMLNNTVFK